MKNLKNLFSGDDYSKKLYQEAQNLVNKWGKTGLLKGLQTDYDRNNMAILLENQARELVKEVSSTGTSQYTEEWSGVALPLVRRIFAEIAAKDFVSVQPMSLPSGLVFYLDFKYGSSVYNFDTTAGTDEWGWQDNSIYGKTSTGSAAAGGLYGAGKFGYSINQSSTASNVVSTASVAWSDVNYDGTLSASLANYTKVVVDMTGTNYDTAGVRAFTLYSGSSAINLPAFTQPVAVAGSYTRLQFIVNSTLIDDGQAVTVYYNVQPANDYSRGDFEDTVGNSGVGGTDLAIPELNLQMKSYPIVAKTRKLKTVWTPEFAQDLNAYHAVDAEVELSALLAEYITMEIDLELLDMLIQNAITVDYWSARVGKIHKGTGATDGEADWTTQTYAAGDLAYTQNSWFQTLGTKLQKLSNAIHQKTMRGGANFLVTSPTIATIIESIPGYAADTDGNAMKFAMGVQKVGALNNRFTVYKNPYMSENTILLGFRGTHFLETGAVYSPYIPLIMTPLIYDPQNLTPRKGVMTRYAKKVVRPEFYAKLFVSDLNYV